MDYIVLAIICILFSMFSYKFMDYIIKFLHFIVHIVLKLLPDNRDDNRLS